MNGTEFEKSDLFTKKHIRLERLADKDDVCGL